MRTTRFKYFTSKGHTRDDPCRPTIIISVYVPKLFSRRVFSSRPSRCGVALKPKSISWTAGGNVPTVFWERFYSHVVADVYNDMTGVSQAIVFPWKIATLVLINASLFLNARFLSGIALQIFGLYRVQIIQRSNRYKL